MTHLRIFISSRHTHIENITRRCWRNRSRSQRQALGRGGALDAHVGLGIALCKARYCCALGRGGALHARVGLGIALCQARYCALGIDNTRHALVDIGRVRHRVALRRGGSRDHTGRTLCSRALDATACDRVAHWSG
jgi:hypothetical protein